MASYGCRSAGSDSSQLAVIIAQNEQNRGKGRMYWFCLEMKVACLLKPDLKAVLKFVDAVEW